ncbi:primosomal protein N' [Alkalinema sp. FACHB-956]|uniref:primosomal protein N' n=1 Tax=Alkalinema sp. FACHB-956 TaxID=2692768 RepID=UPI00168742F6|nr:primosomal protein N' [Alkalinema sp. FACHB-956]MBD2327848.1 primosomal protein N' [Alkalinema sp. FACHB-956]
MPDGAIVPMSPWIEVLVDCPGAQGLYTYTVPQGMEIAVGDVLTVPFGAQQVGAIAIRWLNALTDDLDPQQIRPVESIVSRAFFPSTYWQLLNQVATYYQTSLMQVIRVALPPGLLTRSQRRLRCQTGQQSEPDALPELTLPAQKLWNLLQQSKTGDYSWKFIQQKIKGANRAAQELESLGLVESYLQPPEQIRTKQQQTVTWVSDQSEGLSDRQRAVLDQLKRRGGEVWLAELLQQCQVSVSVVRTLEKKGLVTLQLREILRQEQSEIEADMAKVLTADQTQVLANLRSLQGSQQVLLHGVTGSGKTEVYLQTIAPLLQQGQSALVLVPEIGLTPQLTDRFRARFGDRVCVYHSALSDGERYDTWRQMLLGQPQVVIGTRSAIFAPLPNLGLIILDEEHDSSFKQDQPVPCYHARTVAQWRSQLANCPLILGSATPSFESWATAQRSDSIYLSMPRRIHDRPMPQIQVVDMRWELQSGNRSMFSRALQEHITQLKQTGQQGILFIHRRGHSTHVSCRSCGYVMDCPNCDVPLAYHHTHADAVELLRCHYCGYTQVQPQHCPDCSSPYFKHFGSGTQKVTQELTKLFPELRVLRFDSDTTRTKGAHRALLTRFANGDADLLVGTQMLTKGIDLPQVTLVGIVAADGLLHLQDFRASERAFQTLLQVAGRSGRGADPGRVILQTYTPEHPVVQAVVKQDYAAFVAAELPLRAALNYPPTGRLILLKFSSPDAVAVQKAADRVAQVLTQLDAKPDANYELLGPAPAAILRVAQRYRWQILLKSPLGSVPNLPDLATLRSYCGQSVSLTIDIDPMNLL